MIDLARWCRKSASTENGSNLTIQCFCLNRCRLMNTPKRTTVYTQPSWLFFLTCICNTLVMPCFENSKNEKMTPKIPCCVSVAISPSAERAIYQKPIYFAWNFKRYYKCPFFAVLYAEARLPRHVKRERLEPHPNFVIRLRYNRNKNKSNSTRSTYL